MSAPSSSSQVPGFPGLYAVGTWALRCHLLVEGNQAVLVDTGFLVEHRLVQRLLETLGLGFDSLQAILLTHGHLDHAARLAWFRDRAPHAPVFLHPLDAPHLEGTYPYRGVARVCGWMEAVGRPIVRYRRVTPDAALADGDILPFWGGLQVVHLPGHTAGHCGFYSPRHGLLLAGDAFASYRWSTHLPPAIFNSCPELLGASIRRIRELAPQAILPNHCDVPDPRLIARRFSGTFGGSPGRSEPVTA